MVDFQSRDTSRGFGSDDEEETETEPEKEPEPAAEGETEAETADDAVAKTGTDPEPERETGTPAGTEEPPGGGESAASTGDSKVGGESHQEGESRVEENGAVAAAENGPATSTEAHDTDPTGDGGATAATPAPAETATAYAVVTITGDRSLSDDRQGDTVVEAVEGAGAGVVTRDLLRPDYDGIQRMLTTLAGRSDVDVVVTIGGTGVEPDDVTVEALEPLFDKKLPGFGELFRLLAHETEGTAVVRTRATAGIIEGTPVFAVPGTVDGARRAVEEIVLEEGEHLTVDAANESR